MQKSSMDASFEKCVRFEYWLSHERKRVPHDLKTPEQLDSYDIVGLSWDVIGYMDI